VPDRLYFTDSDEANELIARDPLALLIGFALDQQVTPQAAFAGPLKLQQRLGGLDAAALAGMPVEQLEEAFRVRPAVHRFPGTMAKRVHDLCAHVAAEYGGNAAGVWEEATSYADLRQRINDLPGFGEMKIVGLGSVLAKRFGVEHARELVPNHPTLGDVDSYEALLDFQAKKRAHKAEMRAARAAG